MSVIAPGQVVTGTGPLPPGPVTGASGVPPPPPPAERAPQPQAQPQGVTVEGQSYPTVEAAKSAIQAKYPGSTVTYAVSGQTVKFSISQPSQASASASGYSYQGKMFADEAALRSYVQSQYPGATVTPVYSAAVGMRDVTSGGQLKGYNITYPGQAAPAAVQAQVAPADTGAVGAIEAGAGYAFGLLQSGFSALFGAGYATGQSVRSAATGKPYVPLGQAESFGVSVSSVQQFAGSTGAYLFPGGAILHGVGTPGEGTGARIFDVVVGSLPFIPALGIGGGAARVVSSLGARAAIGVGLGATGSYLQGGGPEQIAEGAVFGGAVSAVFPELVGRVGRGVGIGFEATPAERGGYDVGARVTPGQGALGRMFYSSYETTVVQPFGGSYEDVGAFRAATGERGYAPAEVRTQLGPSSEQVAGYREAVGTGRYGPQAAGGEQPSAFAESGIRGGELENLPSYLRANLPATGERGIIIPAEENVVSALATRSAFYRAAEIASTEALMEEPGAAAGVGFQAKGGPSYADELAAQMQGATLEPREALDYEAVGGTKGQRFEGYAYEERYQPRFPRLQSLASEGPAVVRANVSAGLKGAGESIGEAGRSIKARFGFGPNRGYTLELDVEKAPAAERPAPEEATQPGKATTVLERPPYEAASGRRGGGELYGTSAAARESVLVRAPSRAATPEEVGGVRALGGAALGVGALSGLSLSGREASALATRPRVVPIGFAETGLGSEFAYVYGQEQGQRFRQATGFMYEPAPLEAYATERGPVLTTPQLPFAIMGGGGGPSGRRAARETYGYRVVVSPIRIGVAGSGGLERFVPKRRRR